MKQEPQPARVTGNPPALAVGSFNVLETPTTAMTFTFEWQRSETDDGWTCVLTTSEGESTDLATFTDAKLVEIGLDAVTKSIKVPVTDAKSVGV